MKAETKFATNFTGWKARVTFGCCRGTKCTGYRNDFISCGPCVSWISRLTTSPKSDTSVRAHILETATHRLIP
jgi:hypothetical protein